jgi:hypothetical protein
MPADLTNAPRPPALIPKVPPATADVTGAIRKAATSTGASFDYLLATAKAESDLDPNLTMRTSTATGLFQFLEQTWLGVMKTAGRAFGYPHYADAITQTPSGRYEVDDPKLRAEMMELRKDPTVNAAMGGVITQQNAAVVAARIGRPPTDGELYVAHFFGPYAGANVINLARSNPDLNAAALFPAAARANAPIFYDKTGNPRSVAGVYQELIRRYQAAKASPTAGLEAAAVLAPASSYAVVPSKRVTPAVVQATRVPDTAGMTSAFAEVASQEPAIPKITPQAEGSPSVFYSLFETSERRGPVSPTIADMWGAGPAGSNGQGGMPLDLFQETAPAARSLFDRRG